MSNTKIEWAEKSWNPITGCTKVSEGCKNCYAERMAKRLRGRFGYPADDPFKVTFHPKRLSDPIKWKKPSIVFVCSMGDLFHENVKSAYISNVLDVIRIYNQHIFIILTKRPKRIQSVFSEYNINEPIKNLWLGVSCENQETANERIPFLLQTPAAIRLISCEPLLENINFKEVVTQANTYITSRDKIDWVIAGGESGPNARPMHPDWVRSIRDQCQAANTPFFFKQWGNYIEGSDYTTNRGHYIVLTDGAYCPWNVNDDPAKVTPPNITEWNRNNPTVIRKVGKKKAGRLLDGIEHNEYPKTY